MVNLDIYVIKETTDEWGDSEVVAIYKTFEECMENRFNYANWCASKGNVWIEHIPGGNNFRPDKRWLVDDKGNIITY